MGGWEILATKNTKVHKEGARPAPIVVQWFHASWRVDNIPSLKKQFMLPILTFWAMVFGTIAIWILAEWLFIREVARTWRNPLIGLAMKSLCTLIIVADIAFLICALFQTREDWIFHHGNRWNGFCWGDVAGILFCTVITPLVSSLIALGDIFNSWTRLAKSDSMQYVIKFFFLRRNSCHPVSSCICNVARL